MFCLFSYVRLFNAPLNCCCCFFSFNRLDEHWLNCHSNYILYRFFVFECARYALHAWMGCTAKINLSEMCVLVCNKKPKQIPNGLRELKWGNQIDVAEDFKWMNMNAHRWCDKRWIRWWRVSTEHKPFNQHQCGCGYDRMNTKIEWQNTLQRNSQCFEWSDEEEKRKEEKFYTQILRRLCWLTLLYPISDKNVLRQLHIKYFVYRYSSSIPSALGILFAWNFWERKKRKESKCPSILYMTELFYALKWSNKWVKRISFAGIYDWDEHEWVGVRRKETKKKSFVKWTG